MKQGIKRTLDNSLYKLLLSIFYRSPHSAVCTGSINKNQKFHYRPLATVAGTSGPRSGSRISGELTHWGRVTHICVGKLTIIGSDNGLSPDRRQAIIWTNAGLLLIEPLGTNFSEILIVILAFSFKKMRLKVSSAKRRPFCLGLNVLNFFGVSHCICWNLQMIFVVSYSCGWK